MTTAQLSPLSGQAQGIRSPAVLLSLWLLSGIILLAALGNPPVSRTQEARVLETSRQMLDEDWHGWMIPKINSNLRLQKPPLCYWMTASAYKIGGVSEGVGRIPTALLGWLTVGIVFIFGRQLLDDRTALFSCATMLGSYLFYRNMRLAETDAPATLFVTLAIYAVWRGIDGNAAWLHLAGLGTALALLAKGGPGLYPILFTLGYALVERRWDLPRRCITSGAIVTTLLVALPWFAYVATTQGTGVFRYEVNTVTTGRDHWDWPHVYIYELVKGVAPWTGVLPLALIDAIQNWKRDAQVRMLLIWSTAIFLPLCIIGNKQGHYLLPLIPPLMLLIGRMLATATQPGHRLFGWMRAVLFGTLVVAVAGVGAIIWLALRERNGQLSAIDIMAAGSLGLGILVAAVVTARRGISAGYVTFASLAALMMPLLLGVWIGGVYRYTTRGVAKEIRQRFGEGPYVFYGPNVSIPMCFNMRTAIPSAENARKLLAMSSPGTIAI
ncbi:MAG TPA: glycosyltransferase family 39 protein, partial [Tepidisphaeraceae bacterium]